MNNLFWPDENNIEQCFAANIVQSVVNSNGQVGEALNNVGGKTLFNAAFIRPEQVVHF